MKKTEKESWERDEDHRMRVGAREKKCREERWSSKIKMQPILWDPMKILSVEWHPRRMAS